jgi:hypothetical protein
MADWNQLIQISQRVGIQELSFLQESNIVQFLSSYRILPVNGDESMAYDSVFGNS